MSKIEKAFEMFKANSTMARKDFIAKLVNELGLSTAAASTYHYNCKKKFEESNKTAEEAKVVEPVVASNTVAATVESVEINVEEVDDSVVPEFIKKSWAKI